MLLFPIKAGMHVGNYRPGNVTIPTYMQINVCKFNIRGSALCNNSFWGEGRRGEGGQWQSTLHLQPLEVFSICPPYYSRPPKYSGTPV